MAKKRKSRGRPRVHKDLGQLCTPITERQRKRLGRMGLRLKQQSGRGALGQAALIRAALDAVLTRCSKLKFEGVEDEKALTEVIIQEMAKPVPTKRSRQFSEDDYPDPWGTDLTG